MITHTKRHRPDFKVLAPNSILLKNTQQSNSFTSFDVSSGGGGEIQLGFSPRNKDKTGYKKNTTCRLGASYGTSSLINYYTHNSTHKIYDTLKSSTPANTMYLDSVRTINTGANYTSNELRISISSIFRTNADARWSLFAGVGVNCGISLSATTTTYAYSSLTKELVDVIGNHYEVSRQGIDNNSVVRESFKNKTNFSFASYIPMGIDFRMGKKREFWKHAHLFYEMRPTLNTTLIPELAPIVNFGAQQGVGFRYSI